MLTIISKCDIIILYKAKEGYNMKCPNCDSENCQIISDIETSGKNYSAGSGCLGALIFGPLGALCGLCGQGKQTKTKHYWICNNCGTKWQA